MRTFTHPYTKTSSKWFKHLSVRHDIIKLLEENTGKTFSDINCSNIFLDQSSKAQEIKARTNNPAILYLLINEFSHFTFRVIIDKWGLGTAILSFVFQLFYISISLCFCMIFQFGAFLRYFSRFPLFINVSCLCSRFTFCGYREVCTKHLTEKMVLFLLITSYLHLSIQAPSFPSFPFMFRLSQIVPFYSMSQLPG